MAKTTETIQLMRKITAGFALKGTTLHKWAKKNNLTYQYIHYILSHNVQTLEANRLRSRVKQASGASNL